MRGDILIEGLFGLGSALLRFLVILPVVGVDRLK